MRAHARKGLPEGTHPLAIVAILGVWSGGWVRKPPSLLITRTRAHARRGTHSLAMVTQVAPSRRAWRERARFASGLPAVLPRARRRVRRRLRRLGQRGDRIRQRFGAMLPVLNLFLDRRSSTLTAWSFSLAMRRNRSDKGAGTQALTRSGGFTSYTCREFRSRTACRGVAVSARKTLHRPNRRGEYPWITSPPSTPPPRLSGVSKHRRASGE